MAQLEKIGRTSKYFGRPIYRLLEDYEEIPAGFETDLVSAPFIIKWLLPNDHMKLPAIKHDYRRKHRPDLPLEVTDILFLTDLYVAGVPFIKRLICFLAVRSNNRR
jgi:hypothetical protein